WQVIDNLALRDPRVRGIRFRRNFGKAAALSAGFATVQSSIVMTMDGDLQDDPAEIPHFLARLGEGFDVVSGWKQVRHDPWHKVYPSRVFNWLVGRMTGVELHDHNCGMKCYRRDVLKEVRLYGELHRFVPVLAAARGFRVGEIIVSHRPRQFGKSKYGVSRIVKGFLDLFTVWFLTGYGHRPQHALGTVGLVSFAIGLTGMVFLACLWVITRMLPFFDAIHLHQTAMLYYALGALLLGGQLISIGFLAELITFHTGHTSDPFSVAERTKQPSANEPMAAGGPDFALNKPSPPEPNLPEHDAPATRTDSSPNTLR
ncbi:MAG: glycosyltransferase family 2 protein, partial [Pirellulales bacterium]